MAQNAVLGTQGMGPNETARVAGSRTATGAVVPPTPTDAGQSASDHVRVPADTAWWSGERGATTRRPIDVQYWACWVFAVFYPLLMLHLWLAR